MDGIDLYMHKANSDKAINSILGFIEGILMDGKINAVEVDALIKWHEQNEDLLSCPPLNVLLPLLNEYVRDGQCSDGYIERFNSVVASFRSTRYYAESTADIQRLHGILAGLVCDRELSHVELSGLNQWMKNHDYLEENVMYQEVYKLLSPIRLRKELTEADIKKLFMQISKFVDVDNHGLLRTCVADVEGCVNPDFFSGKFDIQGKTVCFTGASERFTKKGWKEYVVSKGANFIDDMNGGVDFLVVCNKGNSAWAHVSYGRKFEFAKKLQSSGHPIRILTEDSFLDV